MGEQQAQQEYIVTPDHPSKKYVLHPTWTRKLRVIMYDNPAVMCPYCGEIDVYLDNPCGKCGRENLPCRQVFVDG
jgi:hypothetical protein